MYQSTRLRLTVDGSLDMTRLSTYSSSDPRIAEVVGSRVVGRGVGTATISAFGGVASTTVTVEAAVLQPSLVSRIVTSLSAEKRAQSFTSEASVGYLYTFAAYANGDVHTLEDDALNVSVLAADRVTHTLAGGRHAVGVVPDARAASCDEELMSVALTACGGSLPAAVPPLVLALPSPVALRPLAVSTAHIAPSDSFARSAALSSRPAESGRLTRALVAMSDGPDKDMLADARVTLTSSDGACVEVAPSLAEAPRWDFRAVPGGACTRAVLTATFTLGSWVKNATATLYIVRPKSLSVAAALHPPCSSSAAALYVLGCKGRVRQRAAFTASYELEADDAGYSRGGTVSLGHADVTLARANLKLLSGAVHEGVAAGGASFGVSLRGQRATHRLLISDDRLRLAESAASVAETVVTTRRVAVSATFSGRGVECTYSDWAVRGSLGTAIEDVASFSVASAYGGVLSVSADGTVTALATHWARASFSVTNACDASDVEHVSLFVNPAAGELDLGEASRAPLQAGSTLEVKLWWDLSGTFSGACARHPIEALVAHLLLISGE